MKTIRQLISSLMNEQDLDQPVIYQYYLAEHFGTDTETFDNVAETFNSLIPNLTDSYETISSTVADTEKTDDQTSVVVVG